MLYESFRTSVEEGERKTLFAQMLQAWRSVPVPEGVQRLGRLRKFPPPEGLASMDSAAASAWEVVVRGTKHALQELRARAVVVEPAVTALFRYMCLRRRGMLHDEDTRLTSLINLQRKADMMYRQRRDAGTPITYAQVRRA